MMAQTKARKPQAKKGVALILALFTTAILITLSLAFLALAIGESKTSRGASTEKAALEASNYGLEFTLNYMGMGTYSDPLGAPVKTWESDYIAGSFNFFNVLTRVTTPRPHLFAGAGVIIQNADDDPTLVNYEPSATLKPFLRRLRLVKTTTSTGGAEAAALPLGADLAYTFDVAVIPVLPSTGVESFRLISTAKVYSRGGSDAVNVADLPIATRVVEAQVLPSSASSYLHFLSNARGLSAQGVPAYSNQTSPPDANGKVIAMADYAMIPANFTENGPIRIDGEDPALNQAVAADKGPQAWYANSGNLRFAANVQPPVGNSNSNVTFQQRLTINAPTNDYLGSGIDDTNSGLFSGGFSTNTPRLGLPKLDLVNMTLAAQYQPNPNPQSQQPAYFSVATSEIPGAKGSSQAAPKPTGGDPFYDHYETQVVNGQSIQVPVDFDFRPRIPNVEITLSNDTITVVKRDNKTGALISTPPSATSPGTPSSFKYDKVSSGVLYVDGGNAVVKTDVPFSGQLSITAGDSANRSTPTAHPNDTIYAQAALELFTEEKARWDQERKNSATPDPTGFLTPPYTVQQLRDAKAAGKITSDPPSSLSDDHPLWPTPATGVNREGNLVVAGDVKTSSDRSATLGLFAQNFVLINTNDPNANNKTLTIDAVMMSKNRNVSIDWDNTGRQGTWNNGVQDTSAWKTMTTPGFQGTLNLRGSIVGEFIDVEGDNEGRGYNIQQFTHNPNLNNLRPPLSPAWDFSILPGGFRFVITHYTDDGSLSTNSALQ